MLTIGDRLPTFALQAVLSLERGPAFAPLTNPGKWLVRFAWPMDFG